MDANGQRVTDLKLLRFNPRARDGREARTSAALCAWSVSIHAPVMDAKYSSSSF